MSSVKINRSSSPIEPRGSVETVIALGYSHGVPIMASDYETFWLKHSFAVVGHEAKKNFPRLTYRGLKKLGKVVFPVDPSAKEIEGDKAYPSLEALPEKVDAVVLEVPKEDTRDWGG
jgi:hypothetical protein